jgi:predicted ester cyclase
MNIPPTGKPIAVVAANIFRIVNGKAVEHWAISDDLGLMPQIGVIPAPGQGK